MMVYVPTLWTMLGLSIFFVGALPKAVALCWAYFILVGFNYGGSSFNRVWIAALQAAECDYVKRRTNSL